MVQYIQWVLFIENCSLVIVHRFYHFIVHRFLQLLLSCRFYIYIYGPFFTNSLCMHIIVGTYSIHGYSIGTNGSLGQKLVGGYQKHGLNYHDLEIEVEKKVEIIYKIELHYICPSQSLRGSRHYSKAATQTAESGKTACLSVAN